ERAHRSRRALGDQALPQDAVAPGDEFHDRLVGLDFGEYVTRLHRIAFILEPLRQTTFLHRRAQRLHEHFGRHGQLSMYMTFFTAAMVFATSGLAAFSIAFAYGIGTSAW